MWPVDAVRLSPTGNDPELIDHEYGVVPPVAVRVAAKVEFTRPAGSAVEDICSGTGVGVEPEADPSTPAP
jgi:hypothetical protein